jgi:hypothetical protein
VPFFYDQSMIGQQRAHTQTQIPARSHLSTESTILA